MGNLSQEFLNKFSVENITEEIIQNWKYELYRYKYEYSSDKNTKSENFDDAGHTLMKYVHQRCWKSK